MTKIIIIGSGFVGQATGKSLIEKGNEVLFVDVLPEKIKQLSEAGFRAVTPDLIDREEAEVVFISVPTPSMENGKVNLDFIEEASRSLGEGFLRNSKNFPVIVVKSTVPPGTTNDLVKVILEQESGRRAGVDFGLAMVPEYLREVVALDDARVPRAVAIGTDCDKSFAILEKIFQSFECPIIHLNPIEAELQKYVHNCFNATKISFFNEMREIAKAVGADSDKIFKLSAITSEGSWNPLYGTKDLGYFDGHCLPKDSAGLRIWAKEKLQLELTVLGAVVDFNDKLRRNKSSIY